MYLYQIIALRPKPIVFIEITINFALTDLVYILLNYVKPFNYKFSSINKKQGNFLSF